MGQKHGNQSIRSRFHEIDDTYFECLVSDELNQVYDRRTKVFRLYLMGKSVREIEAITGITKSTIQRDINHMLESRMMANDLDLSEKLASAIAHYEMLWKEAMDAWEKSKGEQTETHTKTVRDSNSRRSDGAVVKRKSRDGDPKLLAIAGAIRTKIAQLQGLLKGEKEAGYVDIPIKFLTGKSPINPLAEA